MVRYKKYLLKVSLKCRLISFRKPESSLKVRGTVGGVVIFGEEILFNGKIGTFKMISMMAGTKKTSSCGILP